MSELSRSYAAAVELRQRTADFRKALNDAFPEIAAKEDIQKSATQLIDGIIAIKDRNNRLIGFGTTCEPYSQVKEQIQKAVVDAVHENDLFDSLFSFLNPDEDQLVEVRKAVEYEPELDIPTEGIFPEWLA
ncbi:MAG: hypothetical protein COA78_05745 [Blastopirellula sp.]|nr:MAG: hypothetical protein COA78_05745 [Blastopirellula sp.]